MIHNAFFIAALVLSAGASRCEFSTHATDRAGETPAPTAAAAVAVGAPAPGFTLRDAAGKQVALSDFAGKVVVLEWINPDCPFVKRHYQAKTMSDLASRYAGKGVVWLAVNTTHYMGAEDNTKWIESNALPYPILIDATGEVGRLYGAKTTPHMYVIDQHGTLVYAGAIDDDPQGSKAEKLNYVARALDEVLAGSPVTTAQTKPYGCSVKYAN